MEKKMTVRDLKIMIYEVDLHPCLQIVFPNEFWDIIRKFLKEEWVVDDMDANQLIELMSEKDKAEFLDLHYVTVVLIAKEAADMYRI